MSTSCESYRTSCSSPALSKLVSLPVNPAGLFLTEHSEKQIEQINDRLSGIEDTLKNLRLDRAIPSPKVLLESTPASNTTSDPNQSHIESPATFEGASSFASQAITASQAAERSLGNDQELADIADALTSLRNLISSPNTTKVKRETRVGFPGTPRQIPELPLLPANFVLTLLQEFRNKYCVAFLMFGIKDHREIERICQRVYFPTEPVPLAVLTLMNGMLLYMIQELIFEQKYGACEEFVPQLKDFCNLTERNFRLGIETFDLLAFPSLESAKALLIAVSLTPDD